MRMVVRSSMKKEEEEEEGVYILLFIYIIHLPRTRIF